MITRCDVNHQYGQAAGEPPPFHVSMRPAQLHGGLQQRGGLGGGAVLLKMPGGSTGMGFGYNYLGMDPSDPQSWPRPFRPATGMISYLNGGVPR